MPCNYLPLKRGEIRLLTIHPANPTSGPDSPVCCNLEHVYLSDDEDVREAGFKGEDRAWPELCSQLDAASLFKPGAWAQSHALTPFFETGPSSRSHGSLGFESPDLPWRYSWGDYLALSYVWGPQTPAHEIMVDGQPFSVGPNLHAALHQLRSCVMVREGFKVWIDAICINQGDTSERSQQVTRMRDIYDKAWQVVSWLGSSEGGNTASFGLAALRYMGRLSELERPLEGFYKIKRGFDARPFFIRWESYESPFRKEVYRALLDFFTRQYWRRMWILQEVAMARSDAPVLCGASCVSWAEIQGATSLITRDEERLGRDILGSRLRSGWTYEVGMSRSLHMRHRAPERLWRLLAGMLQIQAVQKERVSPPRPSLGQDFLRPLLLARDAAVTEEKDRVYGILGIKAIADRVTILPDYEQPLSTIYRDFSQAILSRGDLNLLRLISNNETPVKVRGSMEVSWKKTSAAMPCSHELPSWAVCWTCAPLPTAHIRVVCNVASDSGSLARPPSFIGLCLIAQGIILDLVDTLGTCHSAEIDDLYPSKLSTGSGTNAYGSLEGARAAFWRTLVCDSTESGETPAPTSYAWLLDAELWRSDIAGVWSHGFGLEEVMRRNKDLVLSGYTMEQLIFGIGKARRWFGGDRVYNPTSDQRAMVAWAINVTAWRRLMGTKRTGRLGLAPAGAKLGDSIAVLDGCDVPMVLRKRGEDGWTVVGECYIHGIMPGEMFTCGSGITDMKIY